MKKMFFLSTMAIMITGSAFWGCKNDQVLTIPENEQARLKSGEIVTAKVCEPSSFPLVARNGIQAGEIIVSNDDYTLTIYVTANSVVSGIQLWVGTDPSNVPRNDKNVPVPARFNYQSSDNDVINISLGSLFPPPPPGGTFDGKTVYIFAHAKIQGLVPKSEDEYSALSEDKLHGASQVDLISSYTVCCQPKGCFPHSASGGNTFAGGVYYYNNTEDSGGSQDIHADNGEVAGTVQYASETISFSFVQEWMFSGTQPMVVIEGCNEPGGDLTLLFTGEPSSEFGVYSVSVFSYPYYKIQYNLQYCNY